MPEEMTLVEYLKKTDPGRNKYYLQDKFLVTDGGLFGINLEKLDEKTRKELKDYYANTFVNLDGDLVSTDCFLR